MNVQEQVTEAIDTGNRERLASIIQRARGSCAGGMDRERDRRRDPTVVGGCGRLRVSR